MCNIAPILKGTITSSGVQHGTASIQGRQRCGHVVAIEAGRDRRNQNPVIAERAAGDESRRYREARLVAYPCHCRGSASGGLQQQAVDG